MFEGEEHGSLGLREEHKAQSVMTMPTVDGKAMQCGYHDLLPWSSWGAWGPLLTYLQTE